MHKCIQDAMSLGDLRVDEINIAICDQICEINIIA